MTLCVLEVVHLLLIKFHLPMEHTLIQSKSSLEESKLLFKLYRILQALFEFASSWLVDDFNLSILVLKCDACNVT